jgi:hypothetical protein
MLNAIITPKAVAAAAAGAICTLCAFTCGGNRICVIFVDDAVCDIVDVTDFVGETAGDIDGVSVFDGLTLFDCVGLPVLLIELVGDGDWLGVCEGLFVLLGLIDAVVLSDEVADALAVCDRVTDFVIDSEGATDEDADGQPKPRVHVGLDENDVPNDFVVVWVDV